MRYNSLAVTWHASCRKKLFQGRVESACSELTEIELAKYSNCNIK
jgi:hypothetical protein